MIRRGIPLSALITGTMLVLIVATTGVVGWSGFIGARQSVDDLWRQLADSIAHRTTSDTLRFLEDAEPHAQISADLIERGLLDPSNPEAFLAYLEHASDAHPAFTWVSYGDQRDGTFLGVYRTEPGQPLQRTIRSQIDDRTTHYIIEQRTEAGWVHLEDHQGVRYYDPRKRPWYTAVVDRPHRDGTWVDPYLFHSRDQPGVTYAMPVRDPIDDQLIGVVCVDFEMAPLSRYLANLRVGKTGRAYVLTQDGLVIGHPEGQLVQMTSDGPDFWPAAEHPDPMLGEAWTAWSQQASPWEPFAFGDYLAVASAFPEASRIPWVVLIVVPSDDLLGHAAQQAQRSVIFGIVAMALAVLLGLLLSRVVARSVTNLRGELLRISRFDLFEEPELSSTIREFNDMGQATVVMKQGLRAFARYVPHQLVRQLLESGQEAKLGAERRELSVLFSDIAGFTTVVESTPPDQILSALGAYLDGMNRAIGAHKGTVCQYLGDGIMAFWGAPEHLPDHAERTCRGALAMQAHASALLERSRSGQVPPLPTRIGIDTGDVMVGNIGAHERFNYGILGDTVNTAARLEGLNKTYGTWIIAGERTVELAGDAILFRPLDRVLLKGKRRPVLVYEVVCTREDASEEVRGVIAAWSQALTTYFSGAFAEALEAFTRFQQAHPDDGPSEVMIARCEAYLRDPPAPDWDGVHVLSGK